MCIYLLKCRIFGDTIWGFEPVLEAGLNYLQLNMFISKEKLNNISFSVNPRPHAVPATVPVSRSINGIDCCPLILTMTVLVSSWTGSSSLLAVFVGKLRVSWIWTLLLVWAGVFLFSFLISFHQFDPPEKNLNFTFRTPERATAFFWRPKFLFTSSLYTPVLCFHHYLWPTHLAWTSYNAVHQSL